MKKTQTTTLFSPKIKHTLNQKKNWYSFKKKNTTHDSIVNTRIDPPAPL